MKLNSAILTVLLLTAFFGQDPVFAASRTREGGDGELLPLVPLQASADLKATPVDVAYGHFLDDAHRHSGGRLSVGSPTRTPGRIEVSLTTNGQRETYVVLEKSSSGRNATVVVGPKDAGAIRSYNLKLGAKGWVIADFEDLDR